MARDEAPPFVRGETWHNGGTITASEQSTEYEGRQYVVEDNDPTGVLAGTGRRVTVQVVRNKSGINLKPGRIVTWKAAAPYQTQVDGYTFATTDYPAGVVDEYLPAAGVPDNDLFFLVLDGPTKFKQLSASASVLVIGSVLVPGTGTSAVHDDAGRVVLQSQAGATTVLGSNLQNVIGFAGVANNSVEDALFVGVVRKAIR